MTHPRTFRRILITLCAALPLSLGVLAGCDDDSPSFDNRGACEDFIHGYNELDCIAGDVELDADQICGGYNETSADCRPIFDCWTENMACMDVGGTEVPTNYTEGCPTACS